MLNSIRCSFPFFKERVHVDDQILDDWEIAQWGNINFSSIVVNGGLSATGPSRSAVHCHCAGAAHSDSTGESIGKCTVQFTLNIGHDIENGLLS